MTNNTDVVWTVYVPERMDGIYVFARPSDAHAFADAVSGDTIIEEQTVCNEAMARALIEAETDDDETTWVCRHCGHQFNERDGSGDPDCCENCGHRNLVGFPLRLLGNTEAADEYSQEVVSARKDEATGCSICNRETGR